MPEDKIHPVYLLKGVDPVRRTEARNALVERLTDPGFRDFDVESIDARAATADQILAAAAGVPFGSTRRVAIVEDAQRLSTDVLEKLKKLLPSQLGPAATLIFVISEAGGDAEKVKGAVRRLENIAKALGKVQTFGLLDRNQAGAWLSDAAAKGGKSLDAAARTELIARAGLSLGALRGELEKLTAYTGERSVITRMDVQTVVSESTEYSIFTLVDAVSEGRAAAALHVLRGIRANNEPPQRIMPMLARQLRLIWQAKMLAEDHGAVDRLPLDPNILKALPFVQDKARRQARLMSWDRLRAGMRLILAKDLALKGIEGPPSGDDEALETLVIGLCG